MSNHILGIIPARSGSKGIPNKNIANLNGKPLIYYTIRESLKADCLERIVVSTDSKEIAEIATSLGIDVPCIRPKHLATDTSKTIDVILHMLDFLQSNDNYKPDIVILLQPTAPLREAFQIDDAVNCLLNSPADSLVSLCRLHEPHPYKLKSIKDGFVQPFIEGTTSCSPRQLLPEVYKLNGALYIAYRDTLYKKQSFFGEKVLPYIMDDYCSVNIDGPLDLKLAELLLNEESE